MDINDQQIEGLRKMKFTARDANMEKQSELKVIIRMLTHESEFGQIGKGFGGDIWNILPMKEYLRRITFGLCI